MSPPEHVTHLVPAAIGAGFDVQLWADGALWVEDWNMSAARIRARINHWPAHRQAVAERPGLRLAGPGSGLVLACGCPTTTTEEEA